MAPVMSKSSGATGSRLRFTVPGPAYLIIDVTGLRRLVLAIDAFEIDAPARSGPGIYDVTAAVFNADATGRASSTAGIQKAIDAAGADPRGRGIVYVPAGLFHVSELRLFSQVSLYLAPGAVLRCDPTAADFHVRFRKKSTGHDEFWFIQTTPAAHDIRIFGRGTIDGNADAVLRRVGLLNHLVAAVDCTRFSMSGLVLRDSGLWGTVVANCDGVRIDRCKHFNRLDRGEDDCLDVCNSRDVKVTHSIAISLDDPYSVKTWEPATDVASQWAGSFEGSRDVYFDDCIAWTRCFAFKIGAGVLRAQENVRFTNSVVFDAAHAIGISHTYGVADVRHVVFDGMDIEQITCDCLGRSWVRIVIDNHNPASKAGSVFDVVVRNVRVRDAGTQPVLIAGLNADRRLQNIVFDHVEMPGNVHSAKTLKELGVQTSHFADGVVVRE